MAKDDKLVCPSASSAHFFSKQSRARARHGTAWQEGSTLVRKALWRVSIVLVIVGHVPSAHRNRRALHIRDMAGQETAAPSDQSNWRRYAVLGAVGSTFAGSILLMSPFVIMQLRSELPFMSTPRHKVLRALEFISQRRPKQLVQAKSPGKQTRRNFYDLGSGDGEAVLAAAEAGWSATGIEMNPTLWLISQIRRLWLPAEVRRRSRFVLGDMFQHRIHSADAVMIFGVKPLMPRIANKISTECKSGTCILSYRFQLPVAGVVDENDGRLHAEMIYDEEEMRVWHMNTSESESDVAVKN